MLLQSLPFLKYLERIISQKEMAVFNTLLYVNSNFLFPNPRTFYKLCILILFPTTAMQLPIIITVVFKQYAAIEKARLQYLNLLKTQKESQNL